VYMCCISIYIIYCIGASNVICIGKNYVIRKIDRTVEYYLSRK